MEVDVESRVAESESLRQVAERRLRFSVRRFAWLVPRASVRFDHLADAPKAPGKRCRVEIQTHLGATLVVSALARDYGSALETATMRARRVLVRHWQRTFHFGTAGAAATATTIALPRKRRTGRRGGGGSPMQLPAVRVFPASVGGLSHA